MVCHGIRALLISQLQAGPSAKQVSKSLTALIAMVTVLVEGIDYGFARGKKAAEIVCFCCDRHPFWMSLLESDPQRKR